MSRWKDLFCIFFVHLCISGIYERVIWCEYVFVCIAGLHHEGIFRVPGSQREVNLLRDAFERGKCFPRFFFRFFFLFVCFLYMC